MIRPKAIEVTPLENYQLLIKFSNGEKRILDMTKKLEHPFYRMLKEKSFFINVHIAGLGIEWATGQDICPDELYYDSKIIP